MSSRQLVRGSRGSSLWRVPQKGPRVLKASIPLGKGTNIETRGVDFPVASTQRPKCSSVARLRARKPAELAGLESLPPVAVEVFAFPGAPSQTCSVLPDSVGVPRKEILFSFGSAGCRRRGHEDKNSGQKLCYISYAEKTVAEIDRFGARSPQESSPSECRRHSRHLAGTFEFSWRGESAAGCRAGSGSPRDRLAGSPIQAGLRLPKTALEPPCG
jgi:hypothetical protein